MLLIQKWGKNMIIEIHGIRLRTCKQELLEISVSIEHI